MYIIGLQKSVLIPQYKKKVVKFSLLLSAKLQKIKTFFFFMVNLLIGSCTYKTIRGHFT